MRGVFVITYYAVREALRARFYIAVAAFALLAIVAGAILGGTPWGDVDQVILSLGWGAINLMSLALAVIYSTQLVQRDKDRRTLYMILARPVSRFAYVLGRYLAMVMLVSVSIVVMACSLWLCVTLFGNRPHGVAEFAWPALWIAGKAASLIGYAIGFSLLFGFLPSLFYTGAIYVAGTTIGTALSFVRQQEGNEGMQALLEIVYYLFPNFGIFDLVPRVVHAMALPPASVLVAGSAYFVGYGLLALAGCAWFFEQRDME